MRQPSARFWFVCLAVLLSGCSLMQAKQVSAPRPAQYDSAPFAMNGRISIKHQGKRDSAGLRWTHQAQSDEMLLLNPLGQTAARIFSNTQGDAKIATLDNGEKHYQDIDAESLMEQVLGWHLPLNGLHHWVLGVANPETSAQIERDDTGRITVLHQSGWEVRYLKYADGLPARLQLSHQDLQVILLIDEWDWDPH